MPDMYRPRTPTKAQKGNWRCTTAILDDRAPPTTFTAPETAQTRQKAAQDHLTTRSSSSPKITPDLASLYRAHISNLVETLPCP